VQKRPSLAADKLRSEHPVFGVPAIVQHHAAPIFSGVGGLHLAVHFGGGGGRVIVLEIKDQQSKLESYQ
jgi:hypothetical protein